MDKVDKTIKKLEGGLRKGAVPGTGFNRVVLDAKLLDRHGLRAPSGAPKESYVVWCVSLGELLGPKKFYYGFTLNEAMSNALKFHYGCFTPKDK